MKRKTPYSHCCTECEWKGFNPVRRWWIGFITFKTDPGVKCPVCDAKAIDNPDFIAFQREQSKIDLKRKMETAQAK